MNSNSSDNALPESEILQARITKNVSIFIKSLDTTIPLNQSVYAINWFNTRFLWLYNIYNMLGSVAVKKVAGTPYFKARVKQVLYGEEKYQRSVLLIVNYPAAGNFKQMAENLYFKLVSLLRIAAVKEFTFGFSRRTDTGRHDMQNHETDKAYVIHHYRAADDIMPQIEGLIHQHDVRVLFSARISSLLFSGDAAQPIEQIPCLMDGIVLLTADHISQIKNALADDNYQHLVQQTQSSFIATLKRVF